MESEKTSILSNGMIWFGAAVSIAEIMTGTLLAPLGFARGVAAIVIGHTIGCVLLYLAGLIGARTGKSAMETVAGSFGSKGSMLFAALNVLQLLGWTAVMILGGARATGVIANPALHTQGETLWSIVIGLLIIMWILAGTKSLDKLNVFAVGGLFILTIVLSVLVFGGRPVGSVAGGTISFGAAVELSAAMPLSWLPLISDYTRRARRPKAATLMSSVSYFIGSCWMYMIGLGAVLFVGETDIAQIMLQAGLGMIGVFIIVVSTVTTTYLDAHSAGVSFMSITSKVSEKWIGVIACVIGTLLAIYTPIEQYENFLYLIGSVFAPMVAILLTDFFIIKREAPTKSVDLTNLILWGSGFVIYRLFMSIDTVLGSTFPVMVITGTLCILVNGGRKHVHANT